MNQVLSLFEKQQGLSNNYNYDFVLGRLRVANQDSWKGITPSTYSSDYNPEPPIFSAKFANHSNFKHMLAIANEDGKIAFQDTTKPNADPEEKALDGTQCHFNAVFDLEWAPGQMKFVSASGDHTAKLWNVTESEIKECRVFGGHTRSVKTAAFRKNDPAVFASGGRDGAILIWDTRAKTNMDSTRADNCIFSGHAGGPGTPISQKKRTRTPKLGPNTTSSSITGLAFQDDMTLISCGAGDGIIKVWDLRRNYSCYKKEPLPKHSLPYAGTTTLKGFTNLLIDEAGVKLYVNCMDHTIYCYNLSSYSTKPMQRYTGFKNGTFYIKSCLSPDGKYLISGSSNEKAYIWNLNDPNPIATLNGHTVEVTCAAWGGTNDLTIVTCSDDARHKIWRVGSESPKDRDLNLYRGFAEMCKLSKSNNVRGNRLKALEFTPKSLKRLVEQNEKTPSSVEKVSTKRTFCEMAGENYDCSGSEQKRTKSMETKGRRLFSPSPSTSKFSTFRSIEDRDSNLSSIIEEYETAHNSKIVFPNPEDSNQENTLAKTGPIFTSNSNSTTKMMSPLSERIDDNFIFSSPPPSTSSAAFASSMTASSHTTALNASLIFSPTSNLPNYVLDGDAPHLGIMSPKRKTKDKVDWLTKIRKQKLMSGRSTLSDKMNGLNAATCDSIESRSNNIDDACLLSPRLQSLRATEYSPRTSHNVGTPRRRISHSGASNGDSPSSTTPLSVTQRMPTSSRKNNETTLLKFFTISSNPQQSTERSQAELNSHQKPSTSTTSISNSHNEFNS